MSNAAMLLHHQAERFYFREARLLDEGRFEEWLALFDDAVRYWMPITLTRETRADSVGGDRDLPLFDDDKPFLTARVARLQTDLAHAEQPVSRTRRFIANVEILSERDSEIEVQCNFIVYQSRLERSECAYFGTRRDRINVTTPDWCILDRRIVLDQAVVPRSISIFF